MQSNISHSLNPLVAYFNKPTKELTKADIIKFAEANNIQMVDFRYVGGDGKLKTLSFILSDYDYLNQILTTGERVDGSSLFPNLMNAGSSDLYVIPRFCTAFINPFNEIPTLSFLCSYFNKDGEPMEDSPEQILHKAAAAFRKTTGMEFQTMGELEFYVIGERESLYPIPDQRGYHESAPFAKFEEFRRQCMLYIAKAGGLIKYGHSEVGNFTLENKIYEQNEIEFLVTDVEDAADQLTIAKWIIRELAYQYDLDVTFAPKITAGKAGSGMHVHTRIVKNGKNQYVTNGELNDTAKRAIAGYMTCASALTAFGNMNPTSYFRLVPHQEAPTSICWGDRNRSVLVRVPLGWTGKNDMVAMANPLEIPNNKDHSEKQTIEFRAPDGSADIYLFMAGICVAARHGFQIPNALEIAEKTYVDINIHKTENQKKMESLQQLPASCWESAQALEKLRNIFQEDQVFPAKIIDYIIAQLKAFDDSNIREEVTTRPNLMVEMVNQFFHCG